MRFAAIGEAMVEFAPAGAADNYGLSFAGDTFNTAWYLARHQPSWQVDFISAVGTDALSDRFVAFAREAGIETDHMMRHRTRSLGAYMIALDNGERSFHYWRDTSAARTLADDPDWLAAALSDANIIYFSGITLAILGPTGRARLFSAIQQAARAGAKVVFDPNMRIRLWPDRQTMCEAITHAAALADLVLPSFDEDASFFNDTTPAQTIRRYQSEGATGVIVKNGAAEVLFAVNGDSGAYAPVPVSQVVDSTAAGDSFNAGFMAAYFDGADAIDAIAAACALSGKVISGRGALVK